jgi:predicted small lipoprotein YifL
MRAAVLLAVAVALGGCGVKGPPRPPIANPTTPPASTTSSSTSSPSPSPSPAAPSGDPR